MQKQGKQNVCILKELSGPTPACSHSDEYPETASVTCTVSFHFTRLQLCNSTWSS